MKKYIVYAVVLIVGMLLGWLLFGSSAQETEVHNHHEMAENNQLWTCSMHPQIMQPEPGDCPICGMDLIPAENDADGLTASQFALTENALALADIQTTKVGEGLAEGVIVELSGKIVENEEANTVQVSYVSGRIEHLHVTFTGEQVSKGQLLATVYSPELYAAQQELITAANLKASQPELYKAVRNKLKLWKFSETQINEIEETGKVRENIPVYATVSGTVTEKLVAQGDYIKQGQALFKIANLNTVWANFDVYENQIEQFKIGQEVKVSTNAYPDKEFKGTVDFINPVLNTKTRTVDLRVVLNNKDAIFKPGMFVTAKIEGNITNSNEVLTIPASAVLWTGERSVVYVKPNPNRPVFEIRNITLGNKTGDAYQVLQGLDRGEEIVTNGTFTVDAAAQLQGKKSMMNTVASNEAQYSSNERIQVSKDFQNQLKKVFDDYIAVKDALLEEDTKKVINASKKLLENITEVETALLTDANAKQHWTTLAKAVEANTVEILNSKKIAMQRSHFKTLSFQFTKLIEVFGVNEKVYLQYCPMADDDKGAYWLSGERQVLNPYFGTAMLTCGEVKQIIE